MSLFVAIAALALGALENPGGQEPAAPQTRPVPSAVGQLEDIVVEGTLESRVRASSTWTGRPRRPSLTGSETLRPHSTSMSAVPAATPMSW